MSTTAATPQGVSSLAQNGMGSARDKDHEVFPVHLGDSALLYRAMFTTMLRFNDVLDVEKLHQAFSTVIQTGDWRKLGGRVKIKENGELELHVPRRFTAQQPPLLWAHESRKTCITDDARASEFPAQAKELTFRPPEELCEFIDEPGFPSTFDQMVAQEAPQVLFKATTFSDATLLAITAPHTTWDAFGILGFLRASQLVLEGKEAQIPPMLGARHDVLHDIVAEATRESKQAAQGQAPEEKKKEEEAKAGQTDGGADEAKTQAAKELPAEQPLVAHRMMLPGPLFARLRSRLEDESTQFFSDGDFLLAWIIQHVARAEPIPRQMTTFNCLNARYCFPALSNAQGVYTQNMVVPVFNNIDVDVLQGPVGPIIMSQLCCIAENSDPEAAAVWLGAFLQFARSAGDSMSILPPGSMPIFMNNLSGVGAGFGVDFSAALRQQGDETEVRSNPLGTAICHYATNEWSGPFHQVRTIILKQKDHAGNFWVEGNIAQRAWDTMKEEIQEI